MQYTEFAADVVKGLSATPKFLSSKYFYDDEGSRLFQAIMALPEYYLTRAEAEIFATQHAAIVEAFDVAGQGFDLIELGAGDGTKTALLIEYALQRGVNFSYTPIDISQEAIDTLTAKFRRDFPQLVLTPQTGDYFHILESLRTTTTRPKIVLFLGSNIGNFTDEQARAFFRRLHDVLQTGDMLLTGFDLQKDPHVILRAYDDAQGVTAAFNLNLLRRINRELGGDFDLAHFSHYALYRPIECAARSFLISRRAQTVTLKAINRSFDFRAWEPIFVEISQKYNLEMIAELAAQSGFTLAQNFFDSQDYFVDALWHY